MPWTRRPAAAPRAGAGGAHPHPHPHPHPGPRARAARGALAGAAALALLLAVAGGDWCRPLLKRYLESHSGRRFDCARVELGFGHASGPTITLRDVRIDNAAWADSRRPFLQARRVSVTLAWRSLWEGVTVVPLVVLEDAQVDMERRADGLRNWRLIHPDDRGPARVRVLALDARRSRLHASLRDIGLELDARADPLPATGTLAGHPGLALTRRLRLAGAWSGHPFDGDARVSDLLAFGGGSGEQRWFAIDGSAHVAGWRIDATGIADDAHALADLDVDAAIAGDGAGASWPLPGALARLQPLSARGHLRKTGDAWQGSGVRVALGRATHAEGDASFSGSLRDDGTRRRADATLREASIDIADLAPLRGDEPGSDAGARHPPGHAWPSGRLDLAPLRAIDGTLDLRQLRIVGSPRGLVQTLHARATLAGGVLDVHDIDLVAAGGHVTGGLRLDAAATPARLSLDARLAGLRPDRAWAVPSGAPGPAAPLVGSVAGSVAIETRGDSVRALVANADGHAALALAAGASVSRRLDARLGLDGGAWLRSLFDGAGRVPVACGELALELAHGQARSTRLVLVTADTRLDGRARADLGRQTLELSATPIRHAPALLALDRSIHVAGAWHAPAVWLGPPDTGTAPTCAGAAAR